MTSRACSTDTIRRFNAFCRRMGAFVPCRESVRSLTLSEREEISRGVVVGCSLRSIAEQLGRSPSTVSREINRNAGRRCYRANRADHAAWDRARRPKRCKLAAHRPLARIVAKQLQQLWSPEQIAGWLKRTYPDDEHCQVSHEVIYRSLFIQARGALKKELLGYLRRQRTLRRSRHTTLKDKGLGKITDTVSIRERPASVEDRAVPGHWEGDLIMGPHNSQIATLVERHTRYVMLAKVNGRDSETVINALIKQAHQLPKELYKSLTWDRGSEMVTLGSHLPPTSRCTSVIRKALGNVGPTKTPMACSDSIFRRVRTCRYILRRNSTPWLDN